MASRFSLSTVLLGLLLTGCGGSGSGPVKGKVTLNGTNVDSGNVIFVPESGPEKPTLAAPITKGFYELPAGPMPGRYQVQVSWPKKTGKKLHTADPGVKTMIDEQQEAIPAKFNRASTLVVEIKSGPNTHDFVLRSP